MRHLNAAALCVALLASSPSHAEPLIDALQKLAGVAPAPAQLQTIASRPRVGRVRVEGHGNRLIDVARRFIGGGNPAGTRGPWCRDFVNVVARRAGYHLANSSRRAIDALRLGHRVATPRPGDLVVMSHHVTIYAGVDHGRVVGLGGNQHHSVRYSSYRPSKVIAFVRL